MSDRRTFLTTVGAVVALTTLARNARGQSPEGDKEAIAILGTGRLGAAMGKLWATNGHPIIYGSRTPGDARVQKLVEETGPQASAVRIPRPRQAGRAWSCSLCVRRPSRLSFRLSGGSPAKSSWIP